MHSRLILNPTIPIEDIVTGGSGAARGAQRQRRALDARDWYKAIFKVEKRIKDMPRESQSHEVEAPGTDDPNGETPDRPAP